MTPAKRAFDIAVVVLLAALLALPFAMLVLWLLLTEGGPVFYVSERMAAPDRPFALWKLRTMHTGTGDGGVSGGDKAARITRAGHWLRASRLDEVPQLWNILRGDMSLVGPRPPLRQYVERFPVLYGQVLRCRPGLTGLATLRFHRHESRLLARCTTPEETDRVYAVTCVPRKARLDLIYARHRTLCFDLSLIGQTAGELAVRRFSRRS